MRSVKITHVKLFRQRFSTEDPVETSIITTGSASRNSQSEKVESKKLFFHGVRKPFFGLQSKKAVFD